VLAGGLNQSKLLIKIPCMNPKTIILFVCMSWGMTGQNSDPASSSRNTLSGSGKQTLLTLVNEARARGCRCGNQKMPPVGAVTWDGHLEDAAAKHCMDMDKHHFLSHSGSDGSTLGFRITKEGFKWKSCAENIAEGYDTEQQVIEGWLKSPAHCKNLMNPGYSSMGVARSGSYWTQDFAGK
jgi:uncharacterized protein YkwD